MGTQHLRPLKQTRLSTPPHVSVVGSQSSVGAEDLEGAIKLVPLLSRRKAICGSSFFGFSGRNKLAKQAGAEPREAGRAGREVSEVCQAIDVFVFSSLRGVPQCVPKVREGGSGSEHRLRARVQAMGFEKPPG